MRWQRDDWLGNALRTHPPLGVEVAGLVVVPVKLLLELICRLAQAALRATATFRVPAARLDLALGQAHHGSLACEDGCWVELGWGGEVSGK